MKLSVLIPTYRRPENLQRCLHAIAQQARLPDQVVVVVRAGDEASRDVVVEWKKSLPVTLCEIERPGVIQAMNVGLAAVTGDVMVNTDDDTEAPPNWLQRIEQHFEADPKLGGLGGRDVVNADRSHDLRPRDTVGRIMPFGRVVGNHHLGTGGARPVDHLKGANMSWRMEAIRGLSFNEELRGQGAQVYFEFAFSLQVANRGWKLVYDPQVWVDHFPAPRFDSDKRGQPELAAIANATYNFDYSLMRFMRPGWKRAAALLWAGAVGTKTHPGAVRGLISRLRGDAWGAAVRGASKRAWREARMDAARDRAAAAQKGTTEA